MAGCLMSRNELTRRRDPIRRVRNHRDKADLRRAAAGGHDRSRRVPRQRRAREMCHREVRDRETRDREQGGRGKCDLCRDGHRLGGEGDLARGDPRRDDRARASRSRPGHRRAGRVRADHQQSGHAPATHAQCVRVRAGRWLPCHQRCDHRGATRSCQRHCRQRHLRAGGQRQDGQHWAGQFWDRPHSGRQHWGGPNPGPVHSCPAHPGPRHPGRRQKPALHPSPIAELAGSQAGRHGLRGLQAHRARPGTVQPGHRHAARRHGCRYRRGSHHRENYPRGHCHGTPRRLDPRREHCRCQPSVTNLRTNAHAPASGRGQTCQNEEGRST